MKKIFLFLSLIFFFAHEINGAAKNMAKREGSCFTQSTTNNVTVSDCVDRQLTHDDLTKYDIDDNGGYYDKCCYFRAMVKGTYYYGCIGLDRDDTIDVIDSIDATEEELAKLLRDLEILEEGEKVKVYSLDCKASYIKFFASVCMLFALLF